MDFISLIGMFAGICTTVSFLPQVIKTWREKNADGLSVQMFSIFTTGVTLWLTYGILKKDLAIILSNSITLVLSALLLYFKFTFKSPKVHS
jgi:MtN3 and saliva related transmembrane protein